MTQDFTKEEDRARLTPTAMLAAINVCRAWKLTSPEAAALVGVSVVAWERVRGGEWSKTMSDEQLARVSAMTGVFAALHGLFQGPMADRWLRLRNVSPLFANLTPLEIMLSRGVSGMLDTRDYVDGLQ